MSKSIPEWQDTISTWAEETFENTEEGIAKHIAREVVELAWAVGLDYWDIRKQLDTTWEALMTGTSTPKKVPEEAADVLILNLALAGRRGFSLEDALIQKHSINLLREWGEPDADGVIEHVRA